MASAHNFSHISFPSQSPPLSTPAQTSSPVPFHLPYESTTSSHILTRPQQILITKMNTSATTQSRAFILGLPNEILHNIATLLLTDPSALCKLSSTCRELEDIARPIIFRSFSEADGSFRAADHGLKAFLETIQENVRLGGFVRTLKIKDMQCSKDARYKHHSLHSTVSLPFLSQQVL